MVADVSAYASPSSSDAASVASVAASVAVGGGGAADTKTLLESSKASHLCCSRGVFVMDGGRFITTAAAAGLRAPSRTCW